MKPIYRWTVVGIAAAGLGMACVVASRHSGQARAESKHQTQVSAIANLDAMRTTNPAKAEQGYRTIVDKEARDPDPKKQDEVAAARMRLGYIAAHRQDFVAARKEFTDAETHYAGQGQSSPDFGGVKDQAAYQAAVCLVAAGKRDQALTALRDFIRKYPMSPLVTAAGKRVRLINGKLDDETARLLQKATTRQEERARFEASVCGPKAIAYVLPILGKRPKDYEAVAKLCGTTDKGTSIGQMRSGLSKLGIKSYAFSLNRKDLQNVPTPAIWLVSDHYLVITHVSNLNLTVHDSSPELDRKIPLSQLPEDNFSAAVITFQIPSIEAERP